VSSKALIGVAIVVLLAAAFGFFALQNPNNSETNQTTNGQTETSTPAPTDTMMDENASNSAMKNETEIILTENGFSPKTITVNKDDKVIFSNESGATATVDSSPHPIHTSYKELNLGTFAQGQELSITFPNTGTYNYHNHLNASQQGTVIVK